MVSKSFVEETAEEVKEEIRHGLLFAINKVASDADVDRLSNKELLGRLVEVLSIDDGEQ